ncbi:Transcriptional activator of glycolytic enzymes domain containing protein [Rhypophila sp. PSN 637]
MMKSRERAEDDEDWYNIKVLVGSDRMQELSYRTQLEETWRVFGAVGLTAEKKTHLPRRAGAQEAETHGTSLTQISQAGRWNASVLCKAYLTHLPRQFMRIVAGFSGTAGDYFLTRAVHEPPAALQRQLWPWIEAWEQRFEARARRKRWSEGGLDDDDLAGDGFLKLLRRLRVVLLQDLAALQPQFPTLPFFSYAPFRGPDWAAFAKSVQASVDDAEEPASLLVKRVLPELYSLQQLDQLLNTKIIMTGYLGNAATAPATAPATGLVPEAAPWPHGPAAWPAIAPSPKAEPAAASGIPIVSCLPKVYTVAEIWREWTEGVAGGPAIESLEEQYGHRWRPGNTMTMQFCRRKVVWDALRALIARGRSEEEAIQELEALRDGQSLNRLVDLLRQRRQRQRHGQNGKNLAKRNTRDSLK